MKRNRTKMLSAGLALLGLVGCNSGGSGGNDEEMVKRLNQANDKVVACKNEQNELKTQIAGLKRQVAEALANPKMQLTDPDIINLIADLRKQRQGGAGGEDVVLGKGDLKPEDASRVVRQHAQGMQVCYERALKKNSSLQYQAGLALMVELTIRPTGAVKEVSIKPSVDADMTECFQNTAMRWKFPPFAGEPVVVAQKVTLTPKT
jgi:hypothetical protein